MNNLKEISPKEINENVFKLIGTDWMLITSGDETSFNTMTASWGGLGFLWKKNVAFTFVRPQRYTFGFVEKNEYLTLTFFDEKYRNALNICGTKSGRDCDKVKEAGLTPEFIDGTTSFKEAKLVLVCRKLYADNIKPDSFLDKDVDSSVYPAKDYHRMYVNEIVKAYVRE